MTTRPLPGEGGAMPPPLTAALALTALAEAAEGYLTALDHAGAEAVRTALACRHGLAMPPPPRSNQVVDRWLPEALAALGPTHPQLAAVIAAAAPHLDWVTYDIYPPDQIGPAFARGHAAAAILGRGAPFPTRDGDDVDMGLFLIAPQVLYRDHAHPAPELYAPLTGPHGWRFAPGEALDVLPAHTPVWNPPHRPHLTKVGRIPFLAFYVWTSDAELPAHVLPADDWPALEALIL
ncbi:MAG: hypothetical protein JJT81_05990 [Rubellimicrobium sp.]|nr:hypothetical protein [Rubellimicrobium sp.]